MSKKGFGIFGRNKLFGRLTKRNEQPTPEPPAVKVTPLREAMLNNLSLDDLQTICTQLEIDYMSLDGGKGRKVSNLMQLCERRKKLPQLLEACQTLKPSINWQKEW